MVTACTGTVLSFAWGEWERSMTPASIHGAPAPATDWGSSEKSEKRPPAFGTPCPTADGIIETAADARNARRDSSDFITGLLLSAFAFVWFANPFLANDRP